MSECILRLPAMSHAMLGNLSFQGFFPYMLKSFCEPIVTRIFLYKEESNKLFIRECLHCVLVFTLL